MKARGGVSLLLMPPVLYLLIGSLRAEELSGPGLGAGAMVCIVLLIAAFYTSRREPADSDGHAPG